MKTADEVINFQLVVNPRLRNESASHGHERPLKGHFRWEVWHYNNGQMQNISVWAYAADDNQRLGGAIGSEQDRVKAVPLSYYTPMAQDEHWQMTEIIEPES